MEKEEGKRGESIQKNKLFPKPVSVFGRSHLFAQKSVLAYGFFAAASEENRCELVIIEMTTGE